MVKNPRRRHPAFTTGGIGSMSRARLACRKRLGRYKSSIRNATGIGGQNPGFRVIASRGFVQRAAAGFMGNDQNRCQITAMFGLAHSIDADASLSQHGGNFRQGTGFVQQAHPQVKRSRALRQRREVADAKVVPPCCPNTGPCQPRAISQISDSTALAVGPSPAPGPRRTT